MGAVAVVTAEYRGPTRRLRRPEDTGRHHRQPDLRPSQTREPLRRRPRPRRDDGVPPRPGPLTWPDRVLRGLAGVLAGGLVVLALGMLAVLIGASHYGLPGPGVAIVIGHLVGAAIAVAGQRVADRDPGRAGTVAAVVVVGLVVLVLGFAWFL